MLNPILKRAIFWVVLPVLFALFLASLIAPEKAGAATGATDTPQVCSWSVANYGTNNGHVLLQAGPQIVYLDYSLQQRTASGCVPQVRTKMNFRCYQPHPTPVNCSVYGQLDTFRNGDLFTTSPIDDGAGSDGIGTVYNGWLNLSPGEYQGKAYMYDAIVNGAYRNVPDGYYGYSHDCVYFTGIPGMAC